MANGADRAGVVGFGFRSRALGTMALALLLLLPVASRAVDPNKVIDLRADKLGLQGPGGKLEQTLDGALWVPKLTVREGTVVSLDCDWSANLVGAEYWMTKVDQTWQVILQADGHTVGFGPAKMPAGTQLGHKSEKSSGLKLPSLDDPSPLELSSKSSNYGTSVKGKLGPMTWKAMGLGTHEMSCVVPKTGFEEPNLSNNVAKGFVVVEAGPSLGGPGVVQSNPEGVPIPTLRLPAPKPGDGGNVTVPSPSPAGRVPKPPVPAPQPTPGRPVPEPSR